MIKVIASFIGFSAMSHDNRMCSEYQRKNERKKERKKKFRLQSSKSQLNTEWSTPEGKALFIQHYSACHGQ